MDKLVNLDPWLRARLESADLQGKSWWVNKPVNKKAASKKNLRRLTYEKNPDESGGTKKNLEARLPTAPLGVEILDIIGLYYPLLYYFWDMQARAAENQPARACVAMAN